MDNVMISTTLITLIVLIVDLARQDKEEWPITISATFLALLLVFGGYTILKTLIWKS